MRELCDRYDILLSADEVITGFGRLGHWFGSERYDIRPDIVCCAKGLSSSYAAIGAVIATDKVMEPFLEDRRCTRTGSPSAATRSMCAIALKNIEIMKRERIVERVREHEDAFRSTLEQLLELPIVGDVRGTGFFYALELVKDKETRETFTDEECETLLRGFLSGALFERGLICRADDRGDPVIQISPPLVAGQAEFDEMAGILGDVEVLDGCPPSWLATWEWMLESAAAEIFVGGDVFPELWADVDGGRAARVFRPKVASPLRRRLINERRMAWT